MYAVPRVKAGRPEDPEEAAIRAANMGLKIKAGYMFRESNAEIGRAAERAGVVVPAFNRKDRWLAWRKRQARIERAIQMKNIKNQRKTSKKKKAGRK